MCRKIVLFAAICLPLAIFAQTDVRGWYADGQVWIVWKETPPLTATYAVYARSTPFTNVGDAALIGRLFPQEWKPGALRQQIDSSATYRVPDGQGGVYQLAANEGLFVYTRTRPAWGTCSGTPATRSSTSSRTSSVIFEMVS